jgi:hypothetical protein
VAGEKELEKGEEGLHCDQPTVKPYIKVRAFK